MALINNNKVKKIRGKFFVDIFYVFCAGNSLIKSKINLVELVNLTEEDFVKILTQPKSALLKQYIALIGAEDVKISFNKDAIDEIARVAFEVNESIENIGARRLQTIMSHLLEEILFDLPNEKIKSVKITKTMVVKAFKDTMADQDLSKYIL